MTTEDKLVLVSKDLATTRRELHALHDLVAVLLAEIAAASPKPEARLDQIIEDEKNIVYAAATVHEDISESLRETLQKKAEFKESVFSLSRAVFARIKDMRR